MNEKEKVGKAPISIYPSIFLLPGGWTQCDQRLHIPVTTPSLPYWIVILLQHKPEVTFPSSFLSDTWIQQLEKQIAHLYSLPETKGKHPYYHVSCQTVALIPWHGFSCTWQAEHWKIQTSFYWRLVFLWRKKILFTEMSIASNMPKQLWFLFLANKWIIC